mmetsp:Transcript_4554/g.3992  ORF Transcript_4554/g.3992 Transcript_4554/m.3992 type:complete len:267 (-) Transcript_4554:121-921(-)
MSSVNVEDIVLEGWVEKKSKHSNTYKRRSGVLAKDTFFVFKKPKKYNNALDKIPINNVVAICLPSDDDKLFVIIDKESNNYHYKISNKEKWANLIKDSNSDIKIRTSINDEDNTEDTNNNINNINNNAIKNTLTSSNSSNSTEITTNVDSMIADDIENDLSIAPIFDYAPRYNTHTDSEIEPPQTIENYDYSILEEIDFYILDIVNGYLRQILMDISIINNSEHKPIMIIEKENDDNVPPKIQDLCALFYFIRKFDTRRLRRDCDF